METATVRDVQRHFGKVLAWVEMGEEVQITRRGKAIARLSPSGLAGLPSVALPDFTARARAIWSAQPEGATLSETTRAAREERL